MQLTRNIETFRDVGGGSYAVAWVRRLRDEPSSETVEAALPARGMLFARLLAGDSLVNDDYLRALRVGLESDGDSLQVLGCGLNVPRIDQAVRH